MGQRIILAFKGYYRKLLVMHMLNQIEEKEKYDPIKKKTSYFIHRRGVEKSQFTSIYAAFIEEEGSADENDI